MSAERDRLTFSATDLDMEIIDQALAQVDQPGQITCAGSHSLYEIVRKLPEGADVAQLLNFTGEDPRLTVSSRPEPLQPAGAAGPATSR